MRGQGGLWNFEDRLKELSAQGDLLENLAATVDFEILRSFLTNALRRCAPSKGGRRPFDPVLNFKMPVLRSPHGPSLAQTSCMVRNRLSWMRFCGFGPGARVPEWIVQSPGGQFYRSEGAAVHVNLVRGLEVMPSDRLGGALAWDELVREALAGDPDGRVAAAAAGPGL